MHRAHHIPRLPDRKGDPMIHVTDTITLEDHDITERFVRATGPAGRNRRKHATAVELRVNLKTANIPDDVKARLVELGGKRVNAAGELRVLSRASESQAENRGRALVALVRLLHRAATPPKPRKPTHPRRAVRMDRRAEKEQHSDLKSERRINLAAETAKRV
jgi:ribosome-associated protein